MENLDKFDDNLSFSNYSYCSRRIQPVELPNGDTYIFFVDMCPDAGEMDFDISKIVGGESKKVTTKKLSDSSLKKGMRTLVGCRTSLHGMASSGLKWVGWKSAATEDQNLPWKYYPFYEVYDFSISYNKAQNILSLFFWTNIFDTISIEVPEGYDYDKIAFQYAPNEFKTAASFSSINLSTVRKVLCCAKGRFIQGSVSATVESPSNENFPYIKCVEYIPIFERPVILHEYQNMDAIITDFGNDGGSFSENPWQISFEQDVSGDSVVNYAVFKHLYTRRGGILVVHESEGTDIRVTLPTGYQAGDKLYVGLRIDTTSGEYEIRFERYLLSISGYEDLRVNIPLYILIYTGRTFKVLVDLRKTITQDIYE